MRAWLYRVEEGVTGFACFVIVASISLQVFCRYGLNHPLSWPEEVAKLAFVWGSFFGATVGVRRRAHIAIEAMVLVLSERTRRAFGVLVKVGVMTVLAVLCWSGAQMVGMASASILPAINVSAAYLYLPVPICAALMMLHFASQCWADMQSVFGRHNPVAAAESRSGRGD